SGGAVAPKAVARAAAPRPVVAAKPAPAVRETASSANQSPRQTWNKIAAEISEKHPLRSEWLDSAQDISEEEGELRVVFPANKAKVLLTPVVKEQGALIEELWKKHTGRKVAFRPEATGEAVVEKAPSPVPITDDFENDPGIEAAIELFGATLEPEEASQS
ncbi:MAG: hypothetical protein ACKOKC_03345, partial [Chthoniobacterales bacterium]